MKNLISKISEVLSRDKGAEDKLIDIALIVKQGSTPQRELDISNYGNTITINGGAGIDPMYSPTLKDGQSAYYSGCGCTWDTDAMGNRFWLLDKQTHRIYNEDARIERIVLSLLVREGLI